MTATNSLFVPERFKADDRALIDLIVAIALALLYKYGHEEISIHYYIASALGIGFTMLLTSALMGLVFLSSGTGHDESIEDRLRDDD